MAQGKAKFLGSTMFGGAGGGNSQESVQVMEYDADLLRKIFKPE